MTRAEYPVGPLPPIAAGAVPGTNVTAKPAAAHGERRMKLMDQSPTTSSRSVWTGLRRPAVTCLLALCLPLGMSAAQNAPPVFLRPAPGGAPAVTGIAPASVPSGPAAPTGQVGSVWKSLGPAPTLNGQPIIPPNNQISGAIQGIAAHPTLPDVLYIGAVNGGVWRTFNATAANPAWTPLTDGLASQSITSLEFDPTDATSQTLVAGSGRLSSYGAVGGARIGVLRTTDGGNTWTVLGSATFANENLLAVAARGNIILAASDDQWGGGAGSGLYRSVDTGATFQLVSGGSGLTAGSISDLVGDPGNPTRFYAAVRKTGIFRSDDSGATWVNVTAGITGISASTVKIKMAVHNSTGNNVVYIGVIDSNNKLGGVWRSANQGGAWTAMDVPTTHDGTQGQIHFSIAADRTSPTIVYIGGDRILNPPYTGNCFRGDSSLALGSQFVSITDGNAGNTAPHADSRKMVTDANGDILRGDDGGIYRRSSPKSNSGTWGTPIGNLAVMEAHDVAYDRVAKIAMIGAQDNGTQIQSASNSLVWQAIFGGDGGDVAIDDQSTPDRSIRYGSFQNLGNFFRKTYDAGNNLISTEFPALTVQGGGAQIQAQFTTPVVVNKVNPVRLIFGGGNSAYESLDRGDTVTALAANFGVNATFTGKPVAYGGWSNGVPNPDVLYYGSGTSVRLRTTAGGAVAATAAAFPGGNVQSIVMNTNDWRQIFVLDSARVFTSANSGASWSNITGNLTGVGTLWTLEFISLNNTNCVVVGTDTGIFCSFVNDLGNWSRVGSGLPTVPVFDLTASAIDQVLIAGTMGRGVWAISTNPNTAPTIAPIADQRMMQNTTSSPIPFTVGDAETPNALIVTASSGNTNLVPNSGLLVSGSGTSRSLTITPTANQAGIVAITITVDDGQASTNTTFNLTVANQPPTISAIADQTTAENVVLAGVAFTIGDPESPADTLTLSTASSNPALVPNNQIAFGGSASNRTVTITPALNQIGTAIITVSVSDSLTITSTQFTLTVTPVNQPPTLNTLPPVSLKINSGLKTVNLAGLTPGPANETGQTLTVTSWSGNPGLIPNPTVNYTSPSATGSLSLTPATNQTGTATIYVVVRDNGGTANGGVDAVTNSFLVTVNYANSAPTLDPLAPLTINEDAGLQTVNLTGISPGPSLDITQSVTITATSSNPGVIPNPTAIYTSPNATGSLQFAPLTNANGSATITVKVKDNGGTANGGADTVTRTFLVTVNPVNDPPTLNNLPPLALAQNSGLQTVNLSGIGPGPANEIGQLVTISATSDTPGLIPTPTVAYTRPNATGTLRFTPVANQFGTATITVTARDNGGTANGGVDAVTNTFLVTVNAATGTPTLDPVNPLTINEDAVLQTVNLTNITVGTGAGPLSVTATSSNPGLIPNPSVAYNDPTNFGSLNFTPAADQFGTAAISVLVSAGTNTLTRVFTVTVTSVNDAPTLNPLTALTINEDSGLQTVGLSGIRPGPANENGQLVTITATSDKPGLIPNPTVNYSSPQTVGTLTFMAVPNQFGSAIVTVVVTDDGGTANGGVNAFTNSFTITVNRVNDPPTLDPIASLTILEDSGVQTVGLTGIADGGDGTNLTVTATSSDPTLIPNPTVAYTNANTTGTLTFAPVTNANGTATIMVVVNDQGGTAFGGIQTVTNYFTVTVTPVNDAPTLDPLSPLTINEEAGPQVVTLAGVTTGPPNESAQTLTVTATSNNRNLILDPTVSGAGLAWSLNYTPQTNQFGLAIITVTIQDNGGTANGGADTVTRSFAITVSPVNHAPALNALTALTINENAGLQTVNLSGISPGPASEAGQVLTVVASSGNPALIPNPTVNYNSPQTVGNLKFTPVRNTFGTANIQVVVTDNGRSGNPLTNDFKSVTNTFTVTVNPVNVAPTLDALPPLTINEDSGLQTVNLTGISAGTPAEAGQLLTFTATSSNPGLIPNPTAGYTNGNPTGTLTFTPVTNANGTATLTVVVQDNGGTANGGVDAVTNTFTVTVIPVNDAPSFTLPSGLVGPPVVAWGGRGARADYGQYNVPVGLTGVIAIAGGEHHSLALKKDGTIVAWSGEQFNEVSGATGVTGATAIAGGGLHSLALKSDGTVVAWGYNAFGQTKVPVGLTGVTAISAGYYHSLALKSDGTVVAWGDGSLGQTNVPVGLSGVPAISAGSHHSLALKSDGTVVAWGDGSLGQTNVPVGLSGVTAISAGSYHSLALKSDGTVVAWGYNGDGSTNVPVGLTGVMAIAAGYHSLALKNDGTVVAWGYNAFGQTNVPAGLSGVTAIAAGSIHSMALVNVGLKINENAGVQTVNLTGISAGPPEEAGQGLSITAMSSDPSIVPDPLVSYLSPQATGSLSFTPVANANGTVTITVVITDSGGTANGGVDSYTNTFNVIINPVNNPPTLDALANLTIYEDSGVTTVNLTGLSPGPANESAQTLTITATSSDLGLLPNPTVALPTSSLATNRLSFTPVANAFGTATISVIVRDNGGRANGGIDAVTNNFTVTIKPVNDAPTLDLIPDPAAILEGAGQQTVNLTGITVGPTNEVGQSLTVTASSSNPTLIPDPTVVYTSPNTTGLVRYTPVAGAFGTAKIRVVVQDNGGTANGGVDSVTNTFLVTVLNVNQRPTLNPLANLILNEDPGLQTVALTGLSPGPANESSQTLTITATSSDPIVIPHPTVGYTNASATGALRFTPVTNASGVATIKVVVQDNGGTANGGIDAVTNTFTITVNAVNDAPTLNAIPNPAAILENAGLQTINLAGITPGPADEAGQTLAITAMSSNPALVPNPTVGYTNANTTGTLTYTPATNASGTATIQVVVQDNGGTANGGVDAVTNTFLVTVTAVNNPPTLNALANLTINEDPGLQTVALTGLSPGPANESSQTLTITATSSDPTVIPHPTVGYTNASATGTVQFTPVANAYGTATVKVVVQDNGGTANGGIDAVTNTFTITVNSVNDAPTLDPLVNLVLNEDAGPQTVSLTGLTSGASNEIQTLTVTATSSTPSLIPNPVITYTSPNTAGTLTFTPVANRYGLATLTVTVKDDGGTANGGKDASVRLFLVTINHVNHAPVLARIPDKIINQGSLLTFTNSAIDADLGDGLTFTLESAPAGANLTTNGVFTWTPAANQAPGTNVMTVRVTDNGQSGNPLTNDFKSLSQPFTVIVNPTNTPPRLSRQTVAVNGDYQFTLTGEAGRSYRVEYSTNLLNWTLLYTVANPDGTIQVVDSGAAFNPFRFYRIVRSP